MYCIAPLTANTLSKIALGLCGKYLTTTVLALPARTPVVLCPAMNTEMWYKKTIQKNIQILVEMGYTHVDPIEKLLACGDQGVGGLAEPPDIVKTILSRI